MEDRATSLTFEGAMPSLVVRLWLKPVDLQLGYGKWAHEAAHNRFSGMRDPACITTVTLGDIRHASLFHRGKDLIGFLHALGHGTLREDMFPGFGGSDDWYAANGRICEDEDRVNLGVL